MAKAKGTPRASAARASNDKSQAARERVLPVAPALLAHHRETLDRILEQWASKKRVPPVLLLTGVTGIGKRQIAYYLAQSLLCQNTTFADAPDATSDLEQDSLFGEPSSAAAPSEGSVSETRILPCGTCSACERALSGNWVDFAEIFASRDDGESGTLKIDQFRQLKATLGFGAFDGKFRITLIRDADRMTSQAANSLLKLLEEPPPGWIVLLTASDASSLLATLVSRCQVLKLKPLPRDVLEGHLRGLGLSAERVIAGATSAQGSWIRAEALASEDTWQLRDRILHFLESPAQNVTSLIDWAAAEPANLVLLLDHLEQGLAELLRWSVAPDTTLTHRSLKQHASAAVEHYGSPEEARRFWTSRADRVFRARQESLAPLNKKLLLQDLLLPFLA